MSKELKGFVEFVREQGVVGLAVGFILGGAISKIVSSLVQDIINPLIGIILGSAGKLNEQFLMVGTAKILWGSFVATFVDFVVIAAVIYYGVKLLGLEKLDKKKS